METQALNLMTKYYTLKNKDICACKKQEPKLIPVIESMF